MIWQQQVVSGWGERIKEQGERLRLGLAFAFREVKFREEMKTNHPYFTQTHPERLQGTGLFGFCLPETFPVK